MNEEYDRYDNIALACGYGPHVPASMVKELRGKFTVAGFMVQLLYEANRNRKGRGPVKAGTPFYKTVEEIEEETGIGRWGQETSKKALIQKGWITIVRKGVPAKNYFTITRKFNMWNQGMSEKMQKAENDKLKGGLTTYRNADGIPTCKNDALPRTRTMKSPVLLQRQQTKTTNKENNFLSVCEQTDDVDVLVEAEKCLPKGLIGKTQLMFRWNELAEKFCFKTHRMFNTAWEKNLAKANKMMPNLSKDGWEEFFRCVSEIMNSYQGTEYVKYFDLGFALRPEKFQNVMEDNVRFPHKYDKAVIKRIITGIKAKNDKVAEEIRWYEGRGDKKLMRKKHKRWIANRDAIAKWQEILTGEQK